MNVNEQLFSDTVIALRKSEREVEALKESVQELSQDLKLKDRDLEELRKVRDALKEQLDIARTEASDLTLFRDREKKHAEAVFIGFRLAIDAMVNAMKGGK